MKQICSLKVCLRADCFTELKLLETMNYWDLLSHLLNSFWWTFPGDFLFRLPGECHKSVVYSVSPEGLRALEIPENPTKIRNTEEALLHLWYQSIELIFFIINLGAMEHFGE